MRLLRLGVLVVACALVMQCGGGGSPTQPNSTTNTPTTFSLSGTIRNSQTGNGISGALATIADGPNANRTATADSGGHYSFSGLVQSGFTVNFSSQFYNPASQGVTLTSNQTLDASLSPIPLFTQSGVGNSVFNLPSAVSTLHITGTYTAFSSNFIVWIGPTGSACGVVLNPNCRLLVNDLVGTGWGKTTSDGVYQTGGGGLVQVIDSDGVQWSMTEVRNSSLSLESLQHVFQPPSMDGMRFNSEAERQQALSKIAIQADMLRKAGGR